MADLYICIDRYEQAKDPGGWGPAHVPAATTMVSPFSAAASASPIVRYTSPLLPTLRVCSAVGSCHSVTGHGVTLPFSDQSRCHPAVLAGGTSAMCLPASISLGFWQTSWVRFGF